MSDKPKFLDLADELETKYDKAMINIELLTQKELRRCLKAALAGKLYPKWVTPIHDAEIKTINDMIELEEIRIKMLIEHLVIEGEIQRASDVNTDTVPGE